ncbi:MAG: hypothetical protein JF616_22900 [Fibrobacteres bacterium]|jgi:hypothetical protein|nr:hypothetical protein [Fibrobacterota bacterium]
MRKELKSPRSELALDRVLIGLERELVMATDDEIVAAASELGMDLHMKGSAAWLGLMHARPRRLEDLFDVADARAAYLRYLRRKDDD